MEAGLIGIDAPKARPEIAQGEALCKLDYGGQRLHLRCNPGARGTRALPGRASLDQSPRSGRIDFAGRPVGTLGQPGTARVPRALRSCLWREPNGVIAKSHCRERLQVSPTYDGMPMRCSRSAKRASLRMASHTHSSL